MFIIYNIGLYKILNKSNDKYENKYGSLVEEVNFMHELYNEIIYPWIENNCYLKMKHNKKKIVIIHIRNKKYIRLKIVI